MLLPIIIFDFLNFLLLTVGENCFKKPRG